MKRAEFLFWMSLILVVAALTFWKTADRVNWLLDAGWVVVGWPLLAVTRTSFTLTPLLYRLLAIHALVLMSGACWTYEQIPIGLWLQDVFQTKRNHFDRFGHFMQGFVPALAFREIYARCSEVHSGRWLNYFAFVSCLAFSAAFELLEWGATLLAGAEADAFLGHQGDPWDAQWDMLWAVIGSLLALGLLQRLHDRCLRRLEDQSGYGVNNAI